MGGGSRAEHAPIKNPEHRLDSIETGSMTDRHSKFGVHV
jgi:hypothetical protein